MRPCCKACNERISRTCEEAQKALETYGRVVEMIVEGLPTEDTSHHALVVFGCTVQHDCNDPRLEDLHPNSKKPIPHAEVMPIIKAFPLRGILETMFRWSESLDRFNMRRKFSGGAQYSTRVMRAQIRRARKSRLECNFLYSVHVWDSRHPSPEGHATARPPSH